MAARGEQLFVAGQIGWDANGKFPSTRLADQVRQALLNVVAVLAEGGATAAHVVRLTWYVTSRDEYYEQLAGYRRSLSLSHGQALPTDVGGAGGCAHGKGGEGGNRGNGSSAGC